MAVVSRCGRGTRGSAPVNAPWARLYALLKPMAKRSQPGIGAAQYILPVRRADSSTVRSKATDVPTGRDDVWSPATPTRDRNGQQERADEEKNERAKVSAGLTVMGRPAGLISELARGACGRAAALAASARDISVVVTVAAGSWRPASEALRHSSTHYDAELRTLWPVRFQGATRQRLTARAASAGTPPRTEFPTCVWGRCTVPTCSPIQRAAHSRSIVRAIFTRRLAAEALRDARRTQRGSAPAAGLPRSRRIGAHSAKLNAGRANEPVSSRTGRDCDRGRSHAEPRANWAAAAADRLAWRACNSLETDRHRPACRAGACGCRISIGGSHPRPTPGPA